MSALQQLIGDLGALQLAVLFVILLVRRHYRLSPIFTLYAGGVCVTSVLLRVFYTREMWMAHQVNVAALRFGVALELTQRIFGAFPAAAATARRTMLALLLLTAAIAMSAGAGDYTQFSTMIVPSLATGTVWILTALAALVLWYRLPLTVLQKAILIGFAPYLLVFTVMMNLLASFGWQHRDWVSYVSTLSYMSLLAYWSWIAWRAAPEAVAPPARRAMVDAAPQAS
jgi:hypothetical protein